MLISSISSFSYRNSNATKIAVSSAENMLVLVFSFQNLFSSSFRMKNAHPVLFISLLRDPSVYAMMMLGFECILSVHERYVFLVLVFLSDASLFAVGNKSIGIWLCFQGERKVIGSWLVGFFFK